MDIPRLLRNKWVLGLAAFAALVALRAGLEPKAAPPVLPRILPGERGDVRASLQRSSMDRAALISSLSRRHVLLVGESHFIAQPQAWLQETLEALHTADGRKTVLLLELPRTGQAALDRYLAGGLEQDLKAAFGRGALPYKSTVRWARSHPDLVSRVVMCDANPWHTDLMRLLLTDTRNDRMAQSIAEAARQHPEARIVAYGGALHMMKAGRYMYDSDTRRPVGQRLPALGVPAKDLAVVWLFAGDDPVDGLWDAAGALDLAGPAGSLPVEDFEANKVFGVRSFGQLVDYGVHLGPATPVKDL